jgi:hypothetical protein
MLTPPVRLQRRRTKGSRLPAGTRCVDRTTSFGNPFRVDRPTVMIRDAAGVEHRVDRVLTVAEAIQQYRRHHGYGWDLERWAAFTTKVRRELSGQNIACYCRPDALCHGNDLLAIANDLPLPPLPL